MSFYVVKSKEALSSLYPVVHLRFKMKADGYIQIHSSRKIGLIEIPAPL